MEVEFRLKMEGSFLEEVFLFDSMGYRSRSQLEIRLETTLPMKFDYGSMLNINQDQVTFGKGCV